MKLKRFAVFAAMALLLVIAFIPPVQGATSADLETAKMLYRHNLVEKAKELFIGAIADIKSPDAVKAESLYWLGQISFDENRYNVALEDWQRLIKLYPQSVQAKEISQRLAQLQQVMGKVADEVTSNAAANAYLHNGDFWSESDRIFHIDSSWLPNVEISVEWYDLVIKEFPGTQAAELAYKKKLFAYIGWTEPGRYGDSYGLKKDFAKYMPLILATFDELQKAFPKSSYLQAFRFQIAQAYWNQKDWVKTREWLQKIIDTDKDNMTFYGQLARMRMNKVEY